MKGINLSVNTVIVIALAILVLVLLSYLFITGTRPLVSAKYENALNRGCKIYLQTNQSTDSIMIGDINGDANPDSLLTACRLYYLNKTMGAEECGKRCRERFPFS